MPQKKKSPFDELPYRFIGRTKELAALNEALIINKAKIVGIIGSVGTGKTALVQEFARQQKSKFPGGIYHFPTMSSIDVLNTSMEFIRGSNKPILILLEEFGYLPAERIRSLISAIFTKRPTAQVIFTSQPTISASISSYEDIFPILHLDDFIRFGRTTRDALELKPEDSTLLSTEPFIRPSIIGPDGNPLVKDDKSYREIVTQISEVSDELLSRLSENPELLHALSPRKFEEVIAEILHRQGFEVSMTPFSRDKGIDIYAASKNTLGTFLYVVQCKKYAPNRPVGVELVRQLYGVVQVAKVTAGIIATTSHFTKGAKELQSQLLYQMSLKDYIEIQAWLKSVLK